MAKVTQKTIDRAAARVVVAECDKALNDLRGKMTSETDPVKRAKLELDIKKKTRERQQANRVVRGKRRTTS